MNHTITFCFDVYLDLEWFICLLITRSGCCIIAKWNCNQRELLSVNLRVPTYDNYNMHKMVRSFFFYLRIASTIFFIDKFYRLQILDLSLFVIEGRSGDLGAKCIIVLIEFVLEVAIVRDLHHFKIICKWHSMLQFRITFLR